MRPSLGLSLAVSGSRIPPAVFSSASARCTITRSPRGWMLSLPLVLVVIAFVRDLGTTGDGDRVAPCGVVDRVALLRVGCCRSVVAVVELRGQAERDAHGAAQHDGLDRLLEAREGAGGEHLLLEQRRPAPGVDDAGQRRVEGAQERDRL